MFALRQDAKTKASTDEEIVHEKTEQNRQAHEKTVQQGHAATETVAAVVAGDAQSNNGSAAAVESRTHDSTERMCKKVLINIVQASALPGESTIDPYVHVAFRTRSGLKGSFNTKYMEGMASPTWNVTEPALLCNKTRPLHFFVYDKNWFFDTLIAKADLDTSQFWEDGFAGDLKLKDGNDNNITSILRVEITS